MPTYTYCCPTHGEFEEEHSIAIELKECSICQKENKPPQKIKRLITVGSVFILSGGGWSKEGYS